MPSILSEEDKETVKRVVPKQTNKIQAVAVAKLYAAYPDRTRWSYTGLQGAVVLSNDLVGNTYWVKLVDVSPAGRGVIWDQEIYDTWNYNQDRTFFHSFETEDCLVGLSFVDEKEAKQFKKKMDEREKNASKATRNTPFGGASQASSGGHKSFLGGIFGGHRHSTAPTPPESPRNSLPPAPVQSHARTHSGSANGFSRPLPSSEFTELEAYDPDWRDNFGNFLREQGLTDDFIKENQGFIVEFLEQQGGAPPAETATSRQPPAAPPPPPGPPSAANGSSSRAPPPPPPPPSNGPSSSGSRRGGPPPPPAPRRSAKAPEPPAPREPTPPQEPPAPPAPRFKAPPALPDAGKYAHSQPASRPTPAVPGPPPPPRPAKTPIEDKDDSHGHRFGVPPPFTGQRLSSNPPPPPARGPAPPPPPRDQARSPLLPSGPPPALPPKVPGSTAPPPPPASSRPVPAPPPRNAVPPPPTSGVPPPPPPPPPPGGAGAPPPPPPPPPPPSGGVPPPPPPPPPAGGAPALPSVPAGRSAMLGDIQKVGGIGGLKKVDRSKIRDRSAAAVPGGSDVGSSGSAAPAGAGAGAGGGMADALAAALQKRKAKVRDSDDEKSDDDW
ncbi:hypothetical protein Micbo1qcDRAFT_193275 [Microdochium bolleyi]|uniref:WH1 domain-domain-containing protein n=1 Tax=Microdochium bolleyi TaxID=196109 RepID=A0A136JA15_9PEZI|nr:hypothetical protein Micbo1qcDRAFT_193275 [Microdochium bolleyi]